MNCFKYTKVISVTRGNAAEEQGEISNRQQSKVLFWHIRTVLVNFSCIGKNKHYVFFYKV